MEGFGGFMVFVLFVIAVVGGVILFDNGKAPAQKNKQEKQESAYAKGCLQSSLEFGCVSTLLFVAVIVCIMLLISATM